MNQEELQPEIVEFKQHCEKTGPLAFLHISLDDEDDETWSSDAKESEPQAATVSIYVGGLSPSPTGGEGRHGEDGTCPSGESPDTRVSGYSRVVD